MKHSILVKTHFLFLFFLFPVLLFGQFNRFLKENYEVKVEATTGFSFNDRMAKVSALEIIYGLRLHKDFLLGFGTGCRSLNYQSTLNIYGGNLTVPEVTYSGFQQNMSASFQMDISNFWTIRKLRKRICNPTVSMRVVTLVHPWYKNNSIKREIGEYTLSETYRQKHCGNLEFSFGGEFILKNSPSMYIQLVYHVVSPNKFQIKDIGDEERVVMFSHTPRGIGMR
ncbi:MAG: hypothetical protein LUD15_13840, partial [Bacteroides sp.]|nr:hypothetical protein [Bacteroides sp.]